MRNCFEDDIKMVITMTNACQTHVKIMCALTERKCFMLEFEI
jgi:hypothetical protein